MISSKIHRGIRLGNRLFQYAFIRSSAKKLSVKFYMPHWAGDEIFELKDKTERAMEIEGIEKTYLQPKNILGFSNDLNKIEDGTEFAGLFMSTRYYSNESEVKEWYTFKEEKIRGVKEKYKHINFSRSTCFHLRFGDKINHPKYPEPFRNFYCKALSRIKMRDQILVFSDQIGRAKSLLKKFPTKLVFIEGNQDYEDLFLMTQCHDFVIGSSTFAWWGAWLSKFDNKIVVVPKEGLLRLGWYEKKKTIDYYPRDWIQIRSQNYFKDHYHMYFLINYKVLPFLNMPWKLKLQRIIRLISTK